VVGIYMSRIKILCRKKMPELEIITTLGDLFTVHDDAKFKTHLSKVECKAVAFEVNKSVVIAHFNEYLAVCNDKFKNSHFISFDSPRWEIELANFLEVNNGSTIFKLDGLTVNVNALGIVERDSIEKLRDHILTQFKPSRKLKREDTEGDMDKKRK
jgi:hypothetical protein